MAFTSGFVVGDRFVTTGDLSRRSKLESLLTAAEERVLTLVSQSKTNREIASFLGISPCTVKRHMEQILRKLQLRNRVEAAIYGLTLKCCTSPGDADCPLKAWRKGREGMRHC
jgi:DNA-binding CsgD family transcriptional regulator